MTRWESWLNTLKGWLSPLWSGILDWYSLALAGVMKLALDALEIAFKPVLSALVGHMSSTLTSADVRRNQDAAARGQPISAEDTIEKKLGGLLGEMKDPKSFAGAFLAQAAGAGATGGIISSTLGPFLLLLQYEIQRTANQARWDPTIGLAVWLRSQAALLYPDNTALGTWPAGTLSPDKLSELAKSDVRDGGWTDERFTGLVEAALTRLDPPELARLRRRGQLTQNDYLKAMYEVGFTTDRAEAYYTSQEFYPTPSDLVRWQAREVFEDRMITRYGLDDEYGNLRLDDFYKAGMTDDQIKNFWRAHWEHASWIQVTEMLHRGLLQLESGVPDLPKTRAEWITRDGEGKAALNDWYRLVEIPPFWREKLTAMSFSPLTRVDVRRMHKVGILSRDELYAAYRTHGFDDTNAERMTDFTIRFNAESDRVLTRSEIERLYRQQTLTRLEAEARLEDLNYGAQEIALILDSANVATLERSRELVKSELRQLYQQGLRPKGEITGALAELGYDVVSIGALFDLWDVEQPAKLKTPSRTDLDKFVAAGIINLTTWSAEYAGLGYDMKYQQWYYALLVTTGKLE